METEDQRKLRLTKILRSKGRELGFFDVKIARADYMTEEAQRLELWLNAGHHGEMRYLENHFDKRVDPRKLVPGAESVVVLGFNYFPKEKQKKDTYKIARYAYGRDYHKVVKKKLKCLYQELVESQEGLSGRFFVDSGPVLERDWARRAGLGWVGKNTLLLNRYQGSYFFLATMILNVELLYDQPIEDYCGSCRRCIDACPTGSIAQEGYSMDASRCISYLTIELKEERLPREFEGQMEDWIFGCDICQEVCPWNRFAKPSDELQLAPKPGLLEMSRAQWRALDPERFDTLFEGSAVRRTKFTGLRRNIDFLLGEDEEP